MYIWILARGDIFANDHLGKYLYSQAIWGFDEEKFLHSLTRQILPLINRYGSMDCQNSKQGIKNYILFWQKINIFKGNYCILSIDEGPRGQKVRLHFLLLTLFWQLEFLKTLYFLRYCPICDNPTLNRIISNEYVDFWQTIYLHK